MKSAKRALEFLTSPFALGILVTVLFTFIAIRFYENESGAISHAFRRLNQVTIDWRLRDRGPRAPNPQIAILAIDQKSIEEQGRWPWSRDKIARLIDKSFLYGARLLAFDIAFTEEDPNTSRKTLEKVAAALYSKDSIRPDVDAVLQQEIKNSDSDEVLASTMKRYSDKIVNGAFYEQDLSEKLANLSPLAELCINIQSRHTRPDEYWRREEINVLTPVEFKLPDSIIDHYKSYFHDILEPQGIKTWLAENTNVATKLTDFVIKMGPPLDPKMLPVLMQFWQDGKLSDLKDGFDEALGNPARAELTIESIDENFNSLMPAGLKASLTSTIKAIKDSYCQQRFLTPNDELLNRAVYKKQWEDDSAYDDVNLMNAWATLQKNSKIYAETSLDDFLKELRSKVFHNLVKNTDDWGVNIPKLAAVTKHSGFFNTELDSDGVIRRSPLFVRLGEWYVPSLALKAFAVLTDKIPAVEWGNNSALYRDELTKKEEMRLQRSVKRFWLRDADENVVMEVPLDLSGNLLINYAGPQNSFSYVSASDILSDEPEMTVFESGHPRRIAKTDFIKDKIFFVGATAIGIFDVRLTPFEENYPGVETHANVLSNLMTEYAKSTSAPGFLQADARERVYMPALLFLFGVVLAWLISYYGSVVGLLITSATLAAIYLIDKYFIFSSGKVVSIMFPILLTALMYIILTFYKYFTEERQKRELKGVFEKYVSPSIVAEVLADPSNLELGGRKQSLTVFFSDVRGFTTISEKLDPKDLSSLLNSYLTPMTQIVFANKGTLDKYIGDAVMAFFGAPVAFNDHAQWACRCALESVAKLKLLQIEYRAKGLPEIDIGIGLNTGEVSVGNMGSDTVRNYTVMGDAVNLASRLEGITKQYGVRIVISEVTQLAVGSGFITRELDRVRVKGKAQPVKIFELMGEGTVSAESSQLHERFQAGIAHYHQREWLRAIEMFTQALALLPADGPSELYIERCNEYLVTPPPPDWDGVFVMTSK